ncbi:MAG: hypothetical protein ABR922_22380 [Streptosporangiaceae bacterium]
MPGYLLAPLGHLLVHDPQLFLGQLKSEEDRVQHVRGVPAGRAHCRHPVIEISKLLLERIDTVPAVTRPPPRR